MDNNYQGFRWRIRISLEDEDFVGNSDSISLVDKDFTGGFGSRWTINNALTIVLNILL